MRESYQESACRWVSCSTLELRSPVCGRRRGGRGGRRCRGRWCGCFGGGGRRIGAGSGWLCGGRGGRPSYRARGRLRGSEERVWAYERGVQEMAEELSQSKGGVVSAGVRTVGPTVWDLHFSMASFMLCSHFSVAS